MGIPSFLSPHRARSPRRPVAQHAKAHPALRAAAGAAVEPLEGRLLLAAAPLYTVTEIAPLGGVASDARAVNDTGQVAITANTSGSPGSQPEHAGRWSAGTGTDLGTLGGDESHAFGINASGRVVGDSLAANGETHAFITGASGLQDLGLLTGGTSSNASAVNDSNVVVGFAQAISDVGDFHAFRWENGTMTDLGTLSGFAPDFSRADAINSGGVIVGESTAAVGESATHAFRWQGGNMTDLGVLSGGTFSAGLGINDAGLIVGRAGTSGGQTRAASFGTGGGTVTDLGVLSGDGYSTANDVNGAGDAVGTSANDEELDGSHAVIFSGGQVIDLNNRIAPGSGWVLGEAFSINEGGQIVGVGLFNGVRRGFLLTPSGAGPDSTPPGVSIAPPVVSAGSLGATSQTVTVTYTDNTAVSRASIGTSDVTISRSSGGALPVTSVNVTPDADGATLTAVYTFTPPGGSWDPGDDGTYTVTVQGNEVRDTNNNAAAQTSTNFNVNLTQFASIIATINPVPAVTSSGATAQTVTVVYTAQGAGQVNASTIDAADLTVSGPGSPALAVTGVTLSPATGNAAQITATYTLTPPGGSWDVADNGTYTVVVNASQVADTDGNFAPTASASFTVSAGEQRPVVDPTFNGGNAVLTPFIAESLVTDSTGHIYLAGRTGDLAAGNSRAVVQRLNVDGTPDAKFGDNSQMLSPEGGNDAWYAIAFDAEGRVYLAGTRNGDFAVARIKGGGGLDKKFGDGGIATADLGTTSDAAYAVAIGPDGSVVLGGGSGDSFAFARFSAEGLVDGGFGTAGKASFDAGTGADVVGAVVVTPDNKIVAAGGSGDAVAVARLNPNGTPDAAFAGGNVLRLTTLGTSTTAGGAGGGSTADRTVGLALQPDGELLVANRTPGGNFGVVRVNADGSVDDDFGSGGIATVDFGGNDDADTVSLQGSGEIFVIGTTDAGGAAQTAVAALTPEGDLNTGFATGGKFTIDVPAATGSGRALQIGNLILRAFGGVQFDGRLLVGTPNSAPGGSSTPLRRLNVPGHGIVGPFGLVNGRNKVLRFLEADGTEVRVSLRGGGTAQALYDGSSVDLIVTGATARSKLLVGGRRGDRRITVRDIRTDGPLASIAAKTATLSGTGFVDGPLGVASFERITGTLAAAGSIGAVNVRGDVSGGRVLAGADFGAGGKVGGTGNAADQFAAASIGKITVRGPVAGAVMGAGLDPVDGEFSDNDNRVIGGADSVIRAVNFRGGVDPSTRVYAGAFGRIRAPGPVDPADDPNFEVL